MEKKLYSVPEVSEMFGKSRSWFSWADRNNKFVYENGDPIEPTSQSKSGGMRKYDLDTVQEIALSLYRGRTINEEGLRKVIAKVIVERKKDKRERHDENSRL